MLCNAFPVYRSVAIYRKLFNFNGILFKLWILISCLFSSTRSDTLNPIEIGLCSDYLIANLIKTSVSTFSQLWFTSDKISNLNRNKLTFITYLDTWLRRDGAPNVNVVLQTLNCSEFGKYRGLCKYSLDSLEMKHTIFDGNYMYIFLQHERNHLWRVIVIELSTGKVIFLDGFENCAKRKRKKLEFYERIYCIINRHMNVDDVKSFLMMNINLKVDPEVSSFEIWCFFKNNTMKKLRFNDREGDYQLISLSLNSNVDITLASVQFVTDNLVIFNMSSSPSNWSFNPFNMSVNPSVRQRRSIEIINKKLNQDLVVHSSDSAFDSQFDSAFDSQFDNSFNYSFNYFSNHSFSHPFNHSESSRIKRSNHHEDYHLYSHSKNHRLGSSRKRPKKRRKHRKKNRLRPNYLASFSNSGQITRRSRKSVDFHLNRLITSLTTYLNTFNFTMDLALAKLIEIKNLAISSLFAFKQTEIVIFRKYYATFHAIESNFFIQPTSRPYIQPNQIYLGCPQPFCFLTTIDDLTYNRITNELLIFRNQYYWSYQIDHKRKRTSPFIQIPFPKLSDAKLISDDNQDININTRSDFPKAFPMYIDAATFIILDDFYYLVAIKDGWAFVHVPRDNKLVPLLLVDYFDERMTLRRVDAMLYQNRQLFVFSGSNYWLYDILEGLKMRFNNKGVMFKNLPSFLDAAFTFNNRFYFFKQNFFYLNDAKGNSLINPQLVHDTFLIGCRKNKLPRDIDMNKLFKAPSLINYYCMRCPGFIIDRFKDKWDINNNTFVTVQPDEEIDERINNNGRFDNHGRFDPSARIDDGRINIGKIDNKAKNQKTSVAIPPVTRVRPGIIEANPIDFPTSRRMSHPILKLTTAQTEKIFDELPDEEEEEDEVTKNDKNDKNKGSNEANKLANTINKIDEFVLNSWSFLTHHLLFGFSLVLSFFATIYLCKRAREKCSPPYLTDEEMLRRKGKARRKEMRRRNRRWN